MIAQRAQYNWQITYKRLSSRVFLAYAMTANHFNHALSSYSFRVKIINSLAW